VIDLGKNYVLTKICLWDLGDAGNFTVASGSTGSWTVLFTDPLSNYAKWNERTVNVTTRYIRVTKANAAKMGEIVFIGYPAGGGGPVTPPPGQTGDLKLAAKTDTTVTLDWSAYAAPAGVTSYKVFRDENLIATAANKQYTDTGRTAGQHLNYAVEAVGAGKLTNSLTVTPGNYFNKLSILAREAVVTASATVAGDYANKAFDGDITSTMSSAGVNPAWVQVAFPATQPISKVRVYLGTINNSSDVNSWRVEAADSEADLSAKTGSYVLAVATRIGVAGNWDEAALAPLLSRKIFRVTAQRTQGGSTVNIREVELFGLDVKTVRKTHNVVVIQYNPVINTPNGSLPVETYFHDHHWQKWPLAADNVARYIEGFRRATGGLLDLKVKNHHILNEFPPVLDGTPVTPATFLDGYNNNTIADDADYAKILNDARFNIVSRVESGEIDGVWIIQCNSANFYETRMAGDGACWVNGPVVGGVTCKRKFVVHGFDYRGRVGGMAHMTGHMAEQTLARIGDRFPLRWKLPVWNTFNLNDPTRAAEEAQLTDVKRFFLADSVNYSYLKEGPHVSYFAAPGSSQLGSIHFPPNANNNYGYYPSFDWLVVDGSWSAGSGKDMTLTGGGNGVKVVAAPSGLGFIMGDGALKAKVNVQSGASGAHAGLLLRTSAYAAGPNAMKGYYVGLDPAGDRVILARLNNSFTIVKTATVALEPNRDYTVKVKAVGNRFDVYVGNMNVPVFTHYDANFTHGTLGLCAYDTPAKFTYFDFKSTANNYSEAWYAYPVLEGAAPITVGPETWDLGGETDIQGGDFLFWWYEHLPKNTGIHITNDINGSTARGRLNTWLPYLFDINHFDGTAVYDAAFPPEDTTPPAPVVNLKATAISGHVVELTWEEPADNIGVTRYDVLRGTTHIAQVASPRFTDTGLAPNTAYTYTVRARDGFGNRSTASVTATTQPGSAYLSDLDWVSAVNGFQNIGLDKANGGLNDLSLGGIRYAKGLGVHANCEIAYAIGAGYKRFRAKVGASDGEWGCSVRFEVWGDGVKRFDSGPMYGTTGPTTQIADIDLDVTGVNSLVIKVLSLDAGISGDHGVWAGARLVP
jgi:chitodextrinase